MATAKNGRGNGQQTRRDYISQSDVPASSLDHALRVPTAIIENYAGRSATPLQLADAMMMSPMSGQFRQLCGASIAYGLTEGGYNAPEVKVTALGRRLLEPLEEGDDLTARRESIMKPRVIREFLQKYNGSPLPRQDIALNVLAACGVPKERAEGVYTLILESAQAAGLIREIKGKQYVDLAGVDATRGTQSESDTASGSAAEVAEEGLERNPQIESVSTRPIELTGLVNEANRRVFVTHGSNREFIDPIKKLLGFGELVPVVSVERQSVSKPVPDKVMDDMRSCSAAIIHVDEEQTLIDKDAVTHTVINPNVLIEIGAAMALYGRRFILLVRDGIRLPSNLQGLFEVRYAGTTLDGDATIRLLEAINDIKKNPIPAKESAAQGQD